MKKDIMIRLVTRQTSDEDEPQTLEITTHGTLENSGSGYLIEYDEIDDELKNCRTAIQIVAPTSITMTRDGNYNSQLIIEKDKRHTCIYSTPFGDLSMGVFASDVSAAIKENGGRIKMKYTIDFNSSMVSENTVNVTVKPLV